MELMLTPLPVGPLLTNAYVLADPATGEAILVDPGGEPERLLAAVEASGCRLRLLLCTHAHFDHISSAAAIQAEWDLPLLCHPEDAPLVEHMPRIQQSYGFPPSPMPRLDAALAAGQTLSLGNTSIEVRHVPGHSPGHVLFAWEGNALVGDCVFAGSIGRTDLPGANFADLERSIQERIYTLPGSTRLHPGHGPATTVAQESATNPFVRAKYS